MFQTHQPSGKVSPAFLPWLLLALLLVVGLAYVYQLGLAWIPFIYVSLLLTIAMGTAIGTVTGRVVKWGKIRNLPAGFLCLMLITAVGLCSKFGIQYLTARSQLKNQIESMSFEDFRAEFQNVGDATPEQWKEIQRQFVDNYTFVQHLEDRIDTGWRLGRGGNGAPVSSWFVPLIWLVELGTILFMAGPIVLTALRMPFCEKLGQWADETETVLLLPITNQEMVDRINAAQSVQELLDLPTPKSDQSDQYAAYTIHSVPDFDSEDAYLSVELQSYTTNSKGETEIKRTSLVHLAIITAAQREQLRMNAEIMNEAFAAYRASLEAEEDASLKGEEGSAKGEV